MSKKAHFKLAQLMLNFGAQRGSVVTMVELEEATGMSYRRLASLRDDEAQVIKRDEIEKLSEFFDCTVEDLIELRNGGAE